MRLSSHNSVLTHRNRRGGAVAKVIEYYIPKDFRAKAYPIEKRGQVIEFRLPKKSA